jgi:hypothetical protein
MMAPAVSIAVALILEELFSKIEGLQAFSGVAAGVTGAIILVGASLAISHGKGHLSYFPSPFETRLEADMDVSQAKRIAEKLVSLPPLATPVIVLCDSNLVIAAMEQLSDTSARMIHVGTPPVPVHDVRQGKNRFLMIEQGWDPSIVQSFDQSGAYAGLPVLAAPYLPIEYKGSRHILAVDEAATKPEALNRVVPFSFPESDGTARPRRRILREKMALSVRLPRTPA